MRAWDNEIDLDEILDIVQMRMLNTSNTFVKFLLLWYISFSKKGKTIESTISDLIVDYNCPINNFNQFSSIMNSISNMIKPIKKLKNINNEYEETIKEDTEMITSMIISLENNFRYACSIMNQFVGRMELGFFYAILLKSKVVTLEEIDELHETIIVKSVACYAALFYHIMKMIDKNALLNDENYPQVNKDEIPKVPIKNTSNDNNISTKSSTKKKPNTASESNTIGDKLNSISKEDASVMIKNKYNINLVELYKNILEDQHAVSKLANKCSTTPYGIRTRLYSFCEYYGLPTPKRNITLDTVLEDTGKSEVSKIEDDEMFQLAQKKNANDIQKIKNSKTFYPSDMKPTTVNPSHKRNNNPIIRGRDGIELKLSEEQMNNIINSGEQWLTLNDGSPYYITSDFKIWRCKPTKEELKIYALN